MKNPPKLHRKRKESVGRLKPPHVSPPENSSPILLNDIKLLFSKDGFLRNAFFLSPIPSLLFLAVSLTWFARDLGPNVYLGYLQADQPTYTAIARSVIQRGNGLFYSNPFDYVWEAPRVLSNFGYILLGWLFYISGYRTIVIWEIWRIFWGALSMGLFAIMVAKLISNNRIRWWSFLVGAFGAGMAWLFVMDRLLGGSGKQWLDIYREVEGEYSWWCLNLFRQSLYPMELQYHTLFLGALLLYLEKRRTLLVILIFILWWTHSITAILTTTIIGLCTISDLILEKNRKDLFSLISLCVLTALFYFYYQLYLPTFPSVKSWIEQTLQFNPSMKVSDWFLAYGILISALPVMLLYKPLRKFMFGERNGRLVLFWGMAAIAWTCNQYFLSRPIQPMHFSRGYIYLFLVLVLSKGIEFFLEKHKVSTTKSATLLIMAISIPLFMGDNILFLTRLTLEPPKQDRLVITHEGKEVINYLRHQPGSLVIFTTDMELGILIAAHTNHRVFASEQYLTPFFDIRINSALSSFNRGDTISLQALGINSIILTNRNGLVFPDWTRNAKNYQISFNNSLYQVGKLGATSEHQQDK